MANSFPYTWEPLSPEDDATVKRCFGDLGSARELVRCLKTFCLKCSSHFLAVQNSSLDDLVTESLTD